MYKGFDEIDFSILPESFAIKTNHDCGGVILVPNKQVFLSDKAAFANARKKISKHLATNFYTLYREYHYKDIEPRVFIEELLGANLAPACANEFEKDDFHNKKDSTNALESSGQIHAQSSINAPTNAPANVPDSTKEHTSYKAPTDYKCHIFGQNLSHIEVIRGRFTHQEEIAMSESWEKLPFDYEKIARTIPPKPAHLDSLLAIARSLGAPFDYVRVDLYEVDSALGAGSAQPSGSRILFGELTFTPAGGTDKFNPQEWDRILGEQWTPKRYEK